MIVRKKFLPLLFVCLLGCNEVAKLPNSYSGKVVYVIDGDTIDVLFDGETERIRFADIDCPEGDQPFGDSATKFVSELCLFKNVTVKNQGERDVHGGLIATIIVNDSVNVNFELVRSGLAWHYKEYSDKKEFSDMEIEARKNCLGLWIDSDATPPWDWR